MAKKGVTASGYSTEYAWQIRAVSYSPVGDEVIPPNTYQRCINLQTSDHLSSLNLNQHTHQLLLPWRMLAPIRFSPALFVFELRAFRTVTNR